MKKFIPKMAKILLSYIDAGQAQIIGNTLNLDEYIEDLLTFANDHSLTKDIPRSNFDLLI